MKEIQNYLQEGLRIGYNQNNILNVNFTDDTKRVIEYLLTVNIAQQLIKWNQEECNWLCSINLEYNLTDFMKNAFLPYRMVGGFFDSELIHPSIKSFLKNDKVKKKTDREFRYGRIDIGISSENIQYSNFKESILGIEIKGLNPSTDFVIKDIERLVKTMELKDDNFENSIKECYCLHIKKLGGDKELSSKRNLEKSKEKSLCILESRIRESINFKSKEIDIEITSNDINFKSIEDYKDSFYKNEVTIYEVGIETQIVYGVLIKIYRKIKQR